MLDPATRNPFRMPPAPLATPAPSRPAEIKRPTDLSTVVPAPSLPPPLDLAFIGRARLDSGLETIYVRVGGADVRALTQGVTLPNGYSVTSISSKAVMLRHPLGEADVSLELPAAPLQEVR